MFPKNRCHFKGLLNPVSFQDQSADMLSNSKKKKEIHFLVWENFAVRI